MTPAEAAAALRAALDGIDGLSIPTDPGTSINPPAAVVGLARLTWTNLSTKPTRATFPIHVVVQSDDRSLDRLYELVQPARDAIATLNWATVTAASGVSYLSGGNELPAYEITCEVVL